MNRRADVVVEARQGEVEGTSTAPDRLIRLTDEDGEPSTGQHDRRRQSVGSRTHYDRVIAAHGNLDACDCTGGHSDAGVEGVLTCRIAELRMTR